MLLDEAVERNVEFVLSYQSCQRLIITQLDLSLLVTQFQKVLSVE